MHTLFQALQLCGDIEAEISGKDTPKNLAKTQTGCTARTNMVYRSSGDV